jgi:hypothetical protein
MIICNQCGNSLADGLRFCTECGAGVSVFSNPAPTIISPPEPPRPQIPSAPPPAAAPQQRRNGINPLVFVLPISAVLLIGAAALYLSSKSDPRSNERSEADVYPSNNNSENSNSGRSRTTNSTRNLNMNSNISNANQRVSPSNSNTNTGATTGTLAYCNANNLWVRSTPVLDLSKGNVVGELTRGSRVWILKESTNYDTYNGVTSNWAEVQAADRPLRGWVFRYYLELLEGE